MAGEELADGEAREIRGTGSRVFVLRNTSGVYSCTCWGWTNQSFAIERRTCKHLKELRGAEAERLRVGGPIAKMVAIAAATAIASAPAVVTSSPGSVPALLLAHTWEPGIDPTGWWLSEKLDGVRAYWDGKRLLSRLGNTFVAPKWFIEALPADMILDGELFAGRKNFQRAVSIVRRQDRADAWKEILFVVFDAPAYDGPFEERLRAVEALVARLGAPHVRAHEHIRCLGVPHLKEQLQRVEALGGEGLMIRKAGSRYEGKRSSTLLKVKTFFDAEALIVGYQPGTGKFLGCMGALECTLPNGVPFSVGTGFSDAERKNPPPIGAVIAFRYQELSLDGVPRFPSYIGVRNDVAWPPAPPPKVESKLDAPKAPAPEKLELPRRIFKKGETTWEISLDGASHTIRQRRGLAAKTVSTSFAGVGHAWRDADLRIAERLADGWSEVVD